MDAGVIIIPDDSPVTVEDWDTGMEEEFEPPLIDLIPQNLNPQWVPTMGLFHMIPQQIDLTAYPQDDFGPPQFDLGFEHTSPERVNISPQGPVQDD